MHFFLFRQGDQLLPGRAFAALDEALPCGDTHKGTQIPHEILTWA